MYYINMEETKITYDHKKRSHTLYRCGCNLCEKCWFSLENDHCIYGGPFLSYIKEDDENG
jgi:hypothetical protein